jgi:hypothetical protein
LASRIVYSEFSDLWEADWTTEDLELALVSLYWLQILVVTIDTTVIGQAGLL